jgi:hypothetical protein
MRLILFCCTLVWGVCHGGRVCAEPELEWIRHFGTRQYDSTYDVFPDRNGNVFVSGRTWGSMDGAHAGESDAFLRKFDSAGEVAWTRQLGTSGNDAATGVAADGLGNVYISGWTYESLGGPHAGRGDLFISKYDAVGQPLWTKQFGANSQEEFNAMTIDAAGNLFITGVTDGSLGGPNGGGIDGSPGALEDAFVSKFDANGELLWTRQSSRPGRDMGHDVAIDATGNIYTTGTARILNSDWVATVTKYDASGMELWAKELALHSAVATEAKGVAVDDLGNVFITGDFGAERSMPSDQRAFYCNFDADGELSWCNEFAGGGSSIAQTSEGVSTDGLGNAYFAGYVAGSDSFDPYQQYVSKFAADGTHGWTEQIPSDITAYARAVAADRAGSVYFTGELSGGVAFLGKLRLNDVLAPGDTNGDGLVDLTDLNNVRNHFGGTGLGDTNADGVVDLEDLNAVRNNFGATASSAAVPEPGAGLLLAGGCFGVGFWCAARRAVQRKGVHATARCVAFAEALGLHWPKPDHARHGSRHVGQETPGAGGLFLTTNTQHAFAVIFRLNWRTSISTGLRNPLRSLEIPRNTQA